MCDRLYKKLMVLLVLSQRVVVLIKTRAGTKGKRGKFESLNLSGGLKEVGWKMVLLM